jgi:hypothetical protein
MAGAGKRKGEDYDVIPSLMDVLRDALEASERKPRHVTYHIDRDKKTIARYLNRDHFPTGAEIDSVVAAVSLEAGVDRLALWREAIQATQDTIKRIGLDPRLEAAEAARAARRAAPDPDDPRSPG